MLFFIFMIICAICILFCFLNNKLNLDIAVTFVLIVLSGFIIFIHLIIGGCNLMMKTNYNKDELKVKYENLVENKDNEYVVPEIIEWNKDLTVNKKYQRDFWIGPYIPNIYDDLELIEVK